MWQTLEKVEVIYMEELAYLDEPAWGKNNMHVCIYMYYVNNKENKWKPFPF